MKKKSLSQNPIDLSKYNHQFNNKQEEKNRLKEIMIISYNINDYRLFATKLYRFLYENFSIISSPKFNSRINNSIISG